MKPANATLKAAPRLSRPGFESTMNIAMGAGEWGLILILSVIWGGSFFFIGVAVKSMTPFTIVLCRVGLAASILLAVVRLTGRRLPSSPGVWRSFFVMGALNNLIPFSLIVWGQTHIDSSLAAILNATTPIFSVVLAHLLTGEERLTVNRTVGVIIGWIGAAVLIGTDALRGFGIQRLGQLAVLGASWSYALAAIYGRRFREIDPVVVATGMLCASTLMALPVTLVVDRPWHLMPGAAAWGAIFGLAAVSTALAYIIYFRVLAVAGATNILLVTFLIPVSAILLGVLVLGEHPGWNAFGGMMLIFAGLIAIDGRLLKHIKRSAIPHRKS